VGERVVYGGGCCVLTLSRLRQSSSSSGARCSTEERYIENRVGRNQGDDTQPKWLAMWSTLRILVVMQSLKSWPRYRVLIKRWPGCFVADGDEAASNGRPYRDTLLKISSRAICGIGCDTKGSAILGEVVLSFDSTKRCSCDDGDDEGRVNDGVVEGGQKESGVPTPGFMANIRRDNGRFGDIDD